MSFPLSILLVDDDANVRRMFTLILRNHGHKVETAEDGADALQRIRLRPNDFDLLITDHHMPNLNGIGLVRALNSTLYVGALIVVSGMLTPEIERLYRKLGVTETFEKPACLSRLFETLAEIGKAREQLELQEVA